MVRAMVHSIKHYHQITLSTATTLARNFEVLVTAVGRQDANVSNEVTEGSTIKAIYFEMWVIANVDDQFFTAVVVKSPSGVAGPTFTEMTNLYTFTNKKNILYTTQGLAPNDGVGQPIPLFKGWIKIPKGKQRFGLGDALSFLIASRGSGTLTYCGFATYKEYN